jgi:nucleotide-binding universal stress UspA family protein
MFKTIVWATDGSAEAERALTTALELARDGDGKLIAVHADDRVGGRAGNVPVLADEREIAQSIEVKVKELVDLGVDAELVVVHGTAVDPGDLIARVAEERAADVIVVGTRGHGRLAGMLLGSVTQRLMHVAPCAVLAVPPRVAAPAGTAS